MDPTRVSADTNLYMNTTLDVSSNIENIFNKLFIHKSCVSFVENSALLDVTNVALQSTSQTTNRLSDQPLVESAFQQGDQMMSKNNNAIQVKAHHAIDRCIKNCRKKLQDI